MRALEWPLLYWVRYMVSVHVVRLFAGSVFRAMPLWTFYLRLRELRPDEARPLDSHPLARDVT